MNVLVACEESQEVCKAFLERGHNAFSCDVQPCGGGLPGRHILGDVRQVFGSYWDLIVAFPPCTHLSSSGARWWKAKQADGRQQEAIDFFMSIADQDCQKIAIENPIGIMSTAWRKPDQIIQPWQFGHPESKSTCLWLKGLPKLEPTKILDLPKSGRWSNQTPSGQNKLGPSADRAKIRSKTYAGIARAMAEQWG